MYEVDIDNNGDYTFSAKSKSYSFAISNDGKGISPPDTLLASLGSCIGVYVRKYLDGAKLGAGEFTINIKADLTKEKPFCFKEIAVSVDLRGITLDDKRKEAILSFVRNCPVGNTLKSGTDVSNRLL